MKDKPFIPDNPYCYEITDIIKTNDAKRFRIICRYCDYYDLEFDTCKKLNVEIMDCCAECLKDGSTWDVW